MVVLRRARLVLGWVTVCRQVNHLHLGMYQVDTFRDGELEMVYLQVDSAFYPPWENKMEHQLSGPISIDEQ